ncbi:hypothetical protein Tco_0401952 [Tanacetum coccineum]
MQKSLVRFQTEEQKRETVKLLELENMRQVFDEMIQKASSCCGMGGGKENGGGKSVASTSSSSSAFSYAHRVRYRISWSPLTGKNDWRHNMEADKHKGIRNNV